MKRRLFTILILVLTFIICLQNVFAVSSTAETKPQIVEETYIPIEDHTFDNMGWLGMRALPPIGFCGIVCVDVKNTATGDVQTVQLEYMDMYIGGQWLEAGDYSIERAYIANGNHFVVESDTSNVHIEPKGKTNIELVIRENPEVAEQIEKEHGDFKPNPPREPIPGLTQETEWSMETTVPEIGATQQSVEVESHTEDTGDLKETASSLAITVLVSAAFVGVVFLSVWIIKKKHEQS